MNDRRHRRCCRKAISTAAPKPLSFDQAEELAVNLSSIDISRLEKSFQSENRFFQQIPRQSCQRVGGSSRDWQRQDRVLVQMECLRSVERKLFEQIDSVADCSGVNQKSVCQN